MKRKCIIVGNSGEQGKDNYCAGVEKDLENYKTYLLSPLGGLWYENEMLVLKKPQKTVFEIELNNIQKDEYFLFIFCGHGWYSTPMNSTIIQLNSTEDYDSDKIKSHGNAQMMILDCCRVRSDERIVEKAFKMGIAKLLGPQLHPDDCRRYYDKAISDSGSMLIVMNGCSVEETAGDDSQSGGYFSYSLLTTVKTLYEESSVDTSNKYYSLSAPSVFEKAKGIVQKKTGNRQNPQIEKPRCENYLPFGIIA